MRGDDIHELQQRLNQLGFDAGTEDGIFGSLTRAAVEEFQRNVGLAVDGVAGPGTVEALRRLRRDHQSMGAGVRAREREAHKRLARGGLPGARLLLDPAYGPDDRPMGDERPDEVTWALVARLAGRLAASGADVFLARGPSTTPSGSQRARLANELGVDAVLSLGLNSHHAPVARGCSTYYFGSERSTSEVGRELAELIQSSLVGSGWSPDCRTHAMTWAILRETRMPSVVVEPGFVTSPEDAARLVDPAQQDALAHTLTEALHEFLGGKDPSLVPVEMDAAPRVP